MLVGGAVNVATRILKTMPETPALTGFIERVTRREAFSQAIAKDRALAQP